MKEDKIIKKINMSFNSCTPNNFNDILLECNKLKGNSIKMEKKKIKFNWFKNLSYVACGVILTCVAFLGVRGYNNTKIDSIIAFDVNPSIELQINKNKRIIKASALNDDATAIINKMDLENVDLNVAVYAVIGAMIENGYIDEDQNSILVSVANNDENKAMELQSEISKNIDSILKTSNIDGSILSQTVSNGNGMEEKATKYGITVGKVKLIEEVLKKDHTLTFEALAGMTINEINLINSSKVNNALDEQTTIKTTGTASNKAYIGNDSAKQIVLNHANVKLADIINITVEFDSEDGLLVYEVDFSTKNYEYEYEINAKTGDVVKNEKEVNDDYIEEKISPNNSNNTSNTSTSYISKSKAKTIALNRAGINASSISEYEIELDKADNNKEIDKYEISFNVGNIEYDIEINAKTGSVISFDKEIDD